MIVLLTICAVVTLARADGTAAYVYVSKSLTEVLVEPDDHAEVDDYALCGRAVRARGHVGRYTRVHGEFNGYILTDDLINTIPPCKSDSSQGGASGSGVCACPADRDANLNRCGRRSAFCRGDGGGLSCNLKRRTRAEMCGERVVEKEKRRYPVERK